MCLYLTFNYNFLIADTLPEIELIFSSYLDIGKGGNGRKWWVEGKTQLDIKYPHNL